MSQPNPKGKFFRHPGKGGRRGGRTPKGRQVAEEARAEVRALLGDAPRRNDLLIEHLHLIQDSYGHLSAAHLAALAEEMRLPMAAVFEVATFYAHFDVVKEGQDPPPPMTVRVCDSLTCEMMESGKLLDTLPGLLGDDVRVVRAPCMGRCDTAPTVEVGHTHIDHATSETVHRAVREARHGPDIPAYKSFNEYLADGGYALLQACRAGKHTPEDVISALEDGNLRGLGGAGFPAGRKWRFVRAEAKPRYVAVNADEGEPGTFKDRWVLETDPHRFLEGTLIAAWAVEARETYIYLRDEYPASHTILRREIARLEAEGLVPAGHLILRRGAGAYICGEESAMLESIEGKRGLPRHKPPFAAQHGLFGKPTLINNVETLYWVRSVLENGAEWFAAQGRNGCKGLRAFSVSGRVKEPGVKVAPAGITVRELIDEFCGGMAEGHNFKAYLPGGASGGILPAAKADIPLDFGTLDEYGCFVGSGAIIVVSDKDRMGDVALNLMKFFRDESCGQCTPCRVGTEKAVALMAREEWDEALLTDLKRVMSTASICGLGHAAGNPVSCALTHFRDDVRIKGQAS